MTETWLNMATNFLNLIYFTCCFSSLGSFHPTLCGFLQNASNHKQQCILAATPSVYSLHSHQPYVIVGFIALAANAVDVKVHLPPAFTATPLGAIPFSISRRQAMAHI